LIGLGTDVNARDKEGRIALMYASKEGHTEIVKLLIESEADVNEQYKDESTALMIASYFRYTEVIILLIEVGADVNARNQSMGAGQV
jgi:ankyrin repeat protein